MLKCRKCYRSAGFFMGEGDVAGECVLIVIAIEWNSQYPSDEVAESLRCVGWLRFNMKLTD